MDIGHGVRYNFVETSEGRAKVTTFNLGAFRVNDLTEGVLLKEELLEDFVAVLLVEVAAATDIVRALDTRMKSLFAVLFIDGP